MVYAGCNKIDQALDDYTTITNRIVNASDLLGTDSLLFGSVSDIDASFADGLSNLSMGMDRYQTTNEGVTAAIRSQAEAQYEAELAEYRRYLAWLDEQEKIEKQKQLASKNSRE